MRQNSSTDRAWNGRHLTIKRLTREARDQLIHDAVSRRAFRLCESRNFEPGHQMEDWRRAESEVLRPLNCGFLVSGEKIEVSTDAQIFEEGEITVCVEPQRLTICGTERIPRQKQSATMRVSVSNDNLTFRLLDLPFEIEPSEVGAGFKGRTLQIDLPRAHSIRKGSIHGLAA